MKIAVTGASGFLGSRIVTELLNRNEEVKILVRSAKGFTTGNTNLYQSTGDFTDREQASRLLDECDALIHVAGLTSMHWLSSDEFFRVNTKATLQLIELCREKNIKRMVYVSTVNTIGYGSKWNASTESAAMQYPFTESWYAQSKQAAEREVDKFAEEDSGKHVIVIHPAFLLGDTKPTTSSGRMIGMGYRKKIVMVPSGGKNFVSVDAVAQVCCNALQKGRNGSHYIAGGENLSFRSFYSMLSRVGVYRQKIIVLPDWLILAAAKAGDALRSIKIPTELSSRNLRQLLVNENYSSEKAVKELDMPVLSVEETLENALKK